MHVAAHEIGHALGLMHSQHGRALMHLNATLRGWKTLSQDELWGLHRLYGECCTLGGLARLPAALRPGPPAAGCLDRLFVCASWARRGFCDTRRRLMKRLCPSSCDFCYGEAGSPLRVWLWWETGTLTWPSLTPAPPTAEQSFPSPRWPPPHHHPGPRPGWCLRAGT